MASLGTMFDDDGQMQAPQGVDDSGRPIWQGAVVELAGWLIMAENLGLAESGFNGDTMPVNGDNGIQNGDGLLGMDCGFDENEWDAMSSNADMAWSVWYDTFDTDTTASNCLNPGRRGGDPAFREFVEGRLYSNSAMKHQAYNGKHCLPEGWSDIEVVQDMNDAQGRVCFLEDLYDAGIVSTLYDITNNAANDFRGFKMQGYSRWREDSFSASWPQEGGLHDHSGTNTTGLGLDPHLRDYRGWMLVGNDQGLAMFGNQQYNWGWFSNDKNYSYNSSYVHWGAHFRLSKIGCKASMRNRINHKGPNY